VTKRVDKKGPGRRGLLEKGLGGRGSEEVGKKMEKLLKTAPSNSSSKKKVLTKNKR